MPLDSITTATVGVAVGAMGVISHGIVHRVERDLWRQRDRAVLALVFAFLAGFLFAWVWRFASLSLVPTIMFPGPVTGFLWGAFVWLAFVLPAEMPHVIYRRHEPRSATLSAGAWLSQFVVGGVLCGLVLVP